MTQLTIKAHTKKQRQKHVDIWQNQYNIVKLKKKKKQKQLQANQRRPQVKGSIVP